MGNTQQDRHSQMRYALVTVPPLYGFKTYRMARVQGKCCQDAGEDCNVAMRGSGSPHRGVRRSVSGAPGSLPTQLVLCPDGPEVHM